MKNNGLLKHLKFQLLGRSHFAMQLNDLRYKKWVIEAVIVPRVWWNIYIYVRMYTMYELYKK